MKTPLYEKHLEYKGKIVDFGGWELSVEFSGILEEHEAVRTKAGLFDVSHMGEVIVKGPEANKFVQNLVANDISNLENYQVAYTTMLFPDGGVVDDLLVYKYNEQDYYLVINAANIERDYQWMLDNNKFDAVVTNISNEVAEVALQGPDAQSILQKFVDVNLDDISFFHFNSEVIFEGIPVLVSRTGYTGEDGFEIYMKPEDAPIIWDKILSDPGVIPVGLGARDTLRFEACLPLYGQEIAPDITPLEAGLGIFTKLDSKDDFIGKAALIEQKANGVPRKSVGIEMIGRGIARSHYDVQVDGKIIGHVTTGSYSPTLKKNIALALIDVEYAVIDNEVDVIIRNKPVKAKIIKKPFLPKRYKK